MLRQPVNESCRPTGADAILPWRPVTVCNKGLAPGARFGSHPPERRRLAHWQALGVVPPGLAACSVAAAYVRATGRPPARDPAKRASRAYTAAELAAALAELGQSPRPAPTPPPPADLLAVIWAASLQWLELPSTRMLLSQQCRLLDLRESTYSRRNPGELVARVAVVARWLPLVAARIHLIANAMGETLARPVAVALQEVAQ